MNDDANDHLSEAEIAKRRDEVIRRMLNTPPAPKPAATDKKPRKQNDGAANQR